MNPFLSNSTPFTINWGDTRRCLPLLFAPNSGYSSIPLWDWNQTLRLNYSRLLWVNPIAELSEVVKEWLVTGNNKPSHGKTD